MTKSGDVREYPKIDLPETIYSHYILSDDQIPRDTQTPQKLKIQQKSLIPLIEVGYMDLTRCNSA